MDSDAARIWLGGGFYALTQAGLIAVGIRPTAWGCLTNAVGSFIIAMYANRRRNKKS